MAAVAMDGKALAARLKEEIRQQVEQMPVKPGLAVVLVGEDPASRVYVRGRKKDCTLCGIYSEEYILPQETSQEELLDLIDLLNGREDIDGILVQFPLPDHLDNRVVQLAIRPDKDVDCVHPASMGYIVLGEESLRPCTPSGVMRLLSEYGIDPTGKHCVVVGRSNIVGKPQAMMMLWEDATVTVCHTKTVDLAGECRRADILITAAGQRGLITGDMVKEGAVVIDIAVNRDENGQLCGDAVYDQVAEKASYITPVPGGVGPVTRAMLMENTFLAARRHGK
ncbi:bifunctional 5,10-methylenetetrahydrofolate dehydrogenase/5,10-methenyltetrahydrofolate cyclohydrolase [Pseudoflavonifractor sp. AF19-9AC]|uniref:bifunctional 5,10-methylenetetrahydrofolate dehydrogenase/5,10-methenyltetrahydrofolate cyclohydrolase n=1 Tax=Pseudoflavonifractor sp. AF19-9AC TaxID=2292244 RepID=UPI000E4BB997|nr:bifunctional 5,10-methylenetetrahydrofolate dehydrogenase/5,10-methenyltetrahydrofolate cyclohydrolase [Pseudoflavonifractor sp. AF19-9AC]RHR05631.1 bifunctional 5,10-methylenetetrahydrofolate dehydrogenase/5,10-methenyltetrahydrofolate cyclohydrolase [Pseudoflavonifractor sp. AF19-9AC]